MKYEEIVKATQLREYLEVVRDYFSKIKDLKWRPGKITTTVTLYLGESRQHTMEVRPELVLELMRTYEEKIIAELAALDVHVEPTP